MPSRHDDQDPRGRPTASLAPRVNVLSPAPHESLPAGSASLEIAVFGAANTSVVLYVTVYRTGVMLQNEQVEVHLDRSGEARWHGHTILEANASYVLHTRAQDQGGVVTPLRVVEFTAR